MLVWNDLDQNKPIIIYDKGVKKINHDREFYSIQKLSLFVKK